MKEIKYTAEQMVYFARYIIEKESKKEMSLQTLLDRLKQWEKDRPNELT